MGGGSSTARLASSTSRRAPDLASGDPEQGVVGPPPVSHLPCHDEPPISRATTHHGRWQFHRPSRVLHVTANPNLASNDPAWVVELPLPVLHPHCGEASILFTFRIQISLLKVYTKYKINYITIIVIAKLSNLRKLSVAD